MRGTEFPRPRQLAGLCVHSDHDGGTGDAGRLDRCHADTAAPHDRHRRTRPDAGGAEHRPGSGEHAAPEQGRSVERHVGTYADQRPAVHEHPFGERCQPDELVQLPAVDGQSRRLPCWSGAQSPTVGAEVGATPETDVALAAAHREACDHVVTRRELLHLAADGLHHAGCLVPQDTGCRDRPGTVDEVQVAVAQARGRRPHENLVRTGGVDRDLLDAQAARPGVEHCCRHGCAHRGSPAFAVRPAFGDGPVPGVTGGGGQLQPLVAPHVAQA